MPSRYLKTQSRETDKASTSLKRIRDAQEQLLREGKGIDFTVKCGDRTWQCSGAILAQRCDFFKKVIEGSFQESETKVVKLDEETVEEVDMLLLYLYTLDTPDFDNLTIEPLVAVEAALKLGDKYNLPQLGNAGQQFWFDYFRRHVKNWQQDVKYFKPYMIQLLEICWLLDHNRANSLREGTIRQLVPIAEALVDYEPFLKMCTDKPNMAIMYMKALTANLQRDTMLMYDRIAKRYVFI